MSVLVVADSLTFHGPERGELLTDPRLWPNLMAAELGRPVEVVARQGWTAREAWWALTRDPRVYSSLLPAADLVLLAVGNMDQLPVAIPTYLRTGINHLPDPRLRELARRAYMALNPPLVRLTGGPLRTLPQRQTDAYLGLCVEALRVLRPERPIVGVVPPVWSSKYYPSTRAHPPAARAARAWGTAQGVPMIDWEATIAPFVPAGLNPDGMHWGWEAHRAIARDTAAFLRPLLPPAAG